MTPMFQPFDAQTLDAAAILVGARHRADRTRVPSLPARFEDAGETRAQLQRLIDDPNASGLVAFDGGAPVGLLVGSPSLPSPTSLAAQYSPPRGAVIGYAGYAATGPDPGELYRELYAALAPRWLAAGLFHHAIELSATDETALAAWFSLGFGQYLTLAVRDTAEPPPAPEPERSLRIYQATPAESETVWALVDLLSSYHAGSPIFLPYLRETLPEDRRFQDELLSDPANAHWIAERDGKAIAIQTFLRVPTIGEMARPERGVYLYQGVVDEAARAGGVGGALLRRSLQWAREAGYQWCTLHYFAPNLAGSRFWRRSGFRPLTHRLMRHVDERIAWAHG